MSHGGTWKFHVSGCDLLSASMTTKKGPVDHPVCIWSFSGPFSRHQHADPCEKRTRETIPPESDHSVGPFRNTNMQIHARFEQIDVRVQICTSYFQIYLQEILIVHSSQCCENNDGCAPLLQHATYGRISCCTCKTTYNKITHDSLPVEAMKTPCEMNLGLSTQELSLKDSRESEP